MLRSTVFRTLAVLCAAASCVDDAPELATAPVALQTPLPSSPAGSLPGTLTVDALGQATYTVPLELAPGVDGVQPDLTLRYVSGSGSGLVGVGFALAGWSAIMRCPKTLADDGAASGVRFEQTDALCLDGVRLFLASGTYAEDGSTYRLRRDPTVKVELVGSLATISSFFKVYLPNGRIRTLGQGNVNQRVHGAYTYEWLIGKEEDRYGNTIDYLYEQVTDHGDTVEMYPSEIRYTRHTSGTWTQKVVFSYDATIGVANAGWYHGAERRLTKRLWRVESKSSANVLYAGYIFAYEEGGAGDAAPGPRLIAVHRYDAAGVHQAPTSFTWERGASGLELYSPPNPLPDLSEYGVVLPGDFDGDGRHELLLARQPMDEPDDVITEDARWRMLDLTSGALWDVPRFAYFTPEVDSHFVIDFNGDGLDDVLVARRDVPIDLNDECCAAAGADYLEVLFGAVDSLSGPVAIDDGSTDQIAKVVPLDEDGDGLTDLWMCRGGWWVFARNTLSSSTPAGFAFTQTAVPCALDNIPYGSGRGDELQVMALDGNARQSVLVVPAYAAGVQLADDERGGYQRLAFDAAAGTASLQPTGLPRDLFQRYHADCGASEDGPGTYTEGLGTDLLVDWNSDGFTDVLRAEINVGDTHAELDAILSSLWIPSDIDHIGCKSAWDSADQHLVIRPHYNTGAGFVAGESIELMHRNAHLNYRRNFLQWKLIDAEGDGTADLVRRDMDGDPDGDAWRFLRGDGSGAATPGSFAVAHWPGGYDGSGDEPVSLAEEAVLYTTDVDGDGLHDLIMRQRAGAEDAPAPMRIYRHVSQAAAANLLIGITNGLGERTRITYAPSTSAAIHTRYHDQVRPARPLGSATWLVARVERDAGLADGVWRTTDYHYAGGATSEAGRGSLGFAWIERREGVVTTSTTDPDLEIVRQEFDQSYDATLGDHPFAGQPHVVTHQVRLSGESVARYRVTRTKITPAVIQTALPLGRRTYATVDDTVETQLYLVAQSTCGVGDWCSIAELPSTPRSWERVKNTYDGYTNVQSRSHTRSTGDSTEVVRGAIINDAGAWLLGQVPTEQVTECTADAGCKIRKTAMTYVPGRGTVATLTTEPATPMALRTTYTYDARGNVATLAAKDLAANVTRTSTFTYDATLTRLVSRTNPLLHVTTFDIDPLSGQVWAVTDHNGATVRSLYDGLGRLVRTTHHATLLGPSDGADRSLAYTATSPTPGSALRIEKVQLGGERVAIDHDRLGREIRRTWRSLDGTTTGKDVYQTTAYDARGRVTSVSLPTFADDPSPDGHVVTSYDDGGRRTKVAYPDGSIERWSYERSAITHTDRDGKVDRIDLDGFDRPITMTDALGVQTCTTYGWFGQVRSVKRDCAPSTTALQPVTTYDVDGYGRRVSELSLERGPRVMTYSPFGELRTSADANGVVHTLTRDQLGRVTIDATAAGNTTFTYDTLKKGRLTSSTSLDGVVTTYGYDGFLRETARTTTVAGTAFVFGRSYDPQNRLATLTYPQPAGAPVIAVTHGYDDAGHLRSVSRGGVFLWRADAAVASGDLTSERFGNDDTLVGTRTYDPLTFRPTEIAMRKGGTYRLRDSYVWSPDGDLRERRDQVRAQLEELTYSGAHQLTGERVAAGAAAAVSTTTTYDRLGNRTARTGVAGLHGYNNSNRLASVGTLGLGYDLAGNQTTRGATTMTYTPNDQLRSITAGPVTTYVYDANLQRVRKHTAATGREVVSVDSYERVTEGGVAAHSYHVFAHGRVIAKIDLRKPLAVWQLLTRFVQTDHLGSPAQITDQAGAHLELARYNAWGARRDGFDWRVAVANETAGAVDVGFTGHRRELDAGLVDMRGRMYDPALGRMTGADPVVTDPRRGLTHDRYTYARANPLRYTDPTGYVPDGPIYTEPIHRVVIVDTSLYGSADPTSLNSLAERGAQLAGMAARVVTSVPWHAIRGVGLGAMALGRFIGTYAGGATPPADADGGDTGEDPGEYLEEEQAAEDDGLLGGGGLGTAVGAVALVPLGTAGAIATVGASPLAVGVGVAAGAGLVGIELLKVKLGQLANFEKIASALAARADIGGWYDRLAAELKSGTAIFEKAVLNDINEYLGSQQTDINPFSGERSPDRIWSADGTRSVRINPLTDHDHYHLEYWYNDAVYNVLQRIQVK